MSAIPTTQYTTEEYLARERVAAQKSEYYRGQIFAMAGGSLRHNRISVNLIFSLVGRLRGTSCQPFNSDQRIHVVANGLFTYPDVSIVCGEVELAQKDHEAITNPRVIFEVLSQSTESYDRGKKFDLYRQLESLQEYILVSQDEPLIERFVRQDDGTWVLSVLKGPEAVLELQSVAVAMPLSELYQDVKFGLDSRLRGNDDMQEESTP